MSFKKTARLVARRQCTHDVYELVFELDTSLEKPFVAGQFVSVEIPPKSAEEKMVMRQYSISSIPDTYRFELCVKQIPEGRASHHYFPSLTIGDQITFVGPAGRFTYVESHLPCVFIATGTGIAPFKSMLEDLWKQNKENPMTLIAGVRHEEDVLYAEQLMQAQQKHEFTYIPCVSRPKGTWTGYTGRVTSYLEKTAAVQEAQYYICGNGSVIDDVKALLLAKGIPKEHIFFEKYNNL